MATIKPTTAKTHPATPRAEKDKEPAPFELDGALVGLPLDPVELDAAVREELVLDEVGVANTRPFPMVLKVVHEDEDGTGCAAGVTG